MRIIYAVIAIVLLCNKIGVAQSTFEDMLKAHMDELLAPIETVPDEILPNPVLQSLTAPSGWGGYGSYIFGGIGGNYWQPYMRKPDFISFAGFCFGDPERAVNIALSVNAADVSRVSNFSGNISVSRRVLTGSSISAGAMQLFADKFITDSPGATVYFAFSHAIQSLPSDLNPGSSKLTYTIGIGTGRFYRKSPYDIEAGRGSRGTAVFATLSYELLKKVNFNVEWSGMNLGCSFGLKPFDNPLAVGIGLTNLTRYSSDRVNASFVVCYPLSIKRI
ncbi:hypothetical protein [Mucilaginibacter auburnensis]|nr:hypothetical protein [Mucilaginibacter auburnensis]